MQQILTYAFLVIYTVTILGIVLVIITDNRNPLKTLPWIIVLVFAPVVGLVFYFFFGQNLSKRRIISRRTRRRITMQLEEARDTGRPESPEEHRRLAALLYSTTHSVALYGSRIRLLDTMIYNLSDRMLATYNANPLNEKRPLSWVKENAAIIHYCGSNKPWKKNYIGVLDCFYHEVADAQ